MKIQICLIILLLKSVLTFSQSNVADSEQTPKPLLIKSDKTLKNPSGKIILKTDGGYVRIYKITDSLFLLKAYDDVIYLNNVNINELKEAAKLLMSADKDDKVSLTSFRCDITKGKSFGVDVYWVQCYKQESGVDLSNLTPAEIYALTKTSDVKSVKNSNGDEVVDKAKIIRYEEKIQRFWLENKDLKKIFDIE